MLFRFREFPVYKVARIFRSLVYKTSADFPKDERFALTDQIRRAANSILLNVAEGSNRHSDKDFARFLTMALGSLEEVVACLDIALDEKYLSTSKHANLLSEAEQIAKQIVGFRHSMKS
ncbi:MAG: four helix bundle protein [Patescibacteria group bacterium]